MFYLKKYMDTVINTNATNVYKNYNIKCSIEFSGKMMSKFKLSEL